MTDKSLSVLLKIVEKQSRANRDQLNEEKIWTETERENQRDMKKNKNGRGRGRERENQSQRRIRRKIISCRDKQR